MKYNAFISYRHAELDMEIAKKLHKALETFRIPQAVRERYGKKKIERVFRDQEELPIGSDLDDNITTALRESEYLIVICSPRTPGSYWVLKEIDTFIALHDREHVLAVLIEGEPNESFPAQLLTDANGKAVEPLAADVRGDTPKERDKKFRTELIRLAAPLIGCTYDELRQRNRERVLRRNLNIAGGIAVAVALIGISFGLYNANVANQMSMLAEDKAALAEQTMKMAEEIAEQYNETKKNQSRFYAEESLTLLNEGKRETAVLTALEALPGEDDDRPYVPEAEYALSRALHVYDTGVDIDFDKVLHHEQIVNNMKVTASGNYILSSDKSERVYLWDSRTRELLLKIEPRLTRRMALDSVKGMEADEKNVYVLTEEALTAYDHSGVVLYTLDAQDSYLGFLADMEKERAYLIEIDRINYVDLKSGQVISVLENGDDESFSAKSQYLGKGIFAATHMPRTGENGKVTFWDTESGQSTTVKLKYENILRVAASTDGRLAVVTCNGDYYMGAGVNELALDWLDSEGNLIWSRDMDIEIKDYISFIAVLKVQEYDEGQGPRKNVIFAVENGAYVYSAEDGEETARIVLPSPIEAMLFSSNSPLGIMAYSDGNMDWVDTVKGETLSNYRLYTGLELKDICVMGKERFIMAWQSPDIYVLSYHTGNGMEELPEQKEEQSAVAVSPEGDYYVTTGTYSGDFLMFYDKDGNLMYEHDQTGHLPRSLGFYKGSLITLHFDNVWFIDPHEKKAENVSLEDLGTKVSGHNGSFSENGRYLTCWSGFEIAVIDLEERRVIYEADSENLIGNAIASNDGETVFISRAGERLKMIDTYNGRETAIGDSKLTEISDSYSNAFLCISHTGKYVAMFCADGKVRVVKTGSGQTVCEIPVEARQRNFINFTKDEGYLIVQGDDRVIHIWDIGKEKYASMVADADELKYMLSDEEDGKLLLCDGEGMHVLETESYKRIAFVPDALAYIGPDKAFIQKNKTRIFRSHYLDYKALMEEAGRQFPGASLTEREKGEYNIE